MPKKADIIVKSLKIFMFIGARNGHILDLINDLSKRFPTENFLVGFDFHKNSANIIESYRQNEYTGLVLHENVMPDFTEKMLESLILELFHLVPQDVVFEWVHTRKSLH